jgi:TPR repeat protein
LYGNEKSIPQDYQQALRWFRLASNQGNASALITLGIMYEHGYGVTQDFVQAHKWYNVGGASGENSGAEFRDLPAKKMPPAQIAEAENLAMEWKPKGK